MATTIKLCFGFFLIFFFYTGNARKCILKDIVVREVETGQLTPAGDKVFQVDATNTCVAAVSGVHINANGFSSSIPIDPKIFRLEGSFYLLNNGKRIPSGTTLTFRFASSTPYLMTVISMNPGS